MRKHIELKLKETNTSNSQITYNGYIIGKPQSSAVFAAGNDTMNGCINVDFYKLSCGITATNKESDGKVVRLVYMTKALRKNEDEETHRVNFEILDFYNESMSYRTYSLSTGDEISSPEISVEHGIYMYKITLDGNFFEKEVRAEYTAELGSSEKCISLS